MGRKFNFSLNSIFVSHQRLCWTHFLPNAKGTQALQSLAKCKNVAGKYQSHSLSVCHIKRTTPDPVLAGLAHTLSKRTQDAWFLPSPFYPK